MEGTLKEVKDLDKILREKFELVKDSSNRGSRVYTKVYLVVGNPIFKRIRIFFDGRENKGTIKITDYLPAWAGVVTFTLIQAGGMVQDAIKSMIGV